MHVHPPTFGLSKKGVGGVGGSFGADAFGLRPPLRDIGISASFAAEGYSVLVTPRFIA